MTHDELAMPIAVVWCNLKALLITLMSRQVLPLVPDSTVLRTAFIPKSGPDPRLGAINQLMSSPHECRNVSGRSPLNATR
jgi:hypothetical protein